VAGPQTDFIEKESRRLSIVVAGARSSRRIDASTLSRFHAASRRTFSLSLFTCSSILLPARHRWTNDKRVGELRPFVRMWRGK